MEFIMQPWPWYVSGPLIALLMFLLLWFGERFGVSSTLKTMCTMAGAGKRFQFFEGSWKKQAWNLVFVLGAVIGGYLAVRFLGGGQEVAISQATQNDLKSLGIIFDKSLAPSEIFNFNFLTTTPGFIMLIVGGFAIGFGTRWADGCTSGHAISGLSNLQLSSLIAVIGFFIGGLISTYLLLPLILG